MMAVVMMAVVEGTPKPFVHCKYLKDDLLLPLQSAPVVGLAPMLRLDWISV
jgi:hypothetical protein